MNRRLTGTRSLVLLIGLTGWISAAGQQTRTGSGKFVRIGDTTEFATVTPGRDGFSRTFEPTVVQVYDLDDDSTTYVANRQLALVCAEGRLKDNRRDGLFTFYVIDAADHDKRYKIWEKNFLNDKLDGQSRVFTLRGGLVRYATYKSDSLNGVSRSYWIDGKEIMDEKEYVNGRDKFIQRTYYKNGKIESETATEHGVTNGIVRHYYESGGLEQTTLYKAGKPWEIKGSFTPKGLRRKAGTLRNGNGTVLVYNDDGSVRETKTYAGGEPK
jgi:antitoxin component YwqK of YwqJK toxin-antitoxin module